MPKVEQLAGGLSIQHNQNGFAVVRLHYSADENKSGNWADHLKRSYISDIWNQEQELDFTKASGKRVYPEFKSELHIGDLQPVPHVTIWRGWDFGYHHPACVWAQVHGDRLNVLAELLGEEIVINDFALQVKAISKKLFHGYDFLDAGDPAVRAQSDKSERTSADILRSMDIRIQTKPLLVRDGLNIIRNLLIPMPDGNVRMKVDFECKLLVDGFLGGYTRDDDDEPVKDGYYDHLFDALRYLVGVLYNQKTYTVVRPSYPVSKVRKTADAVTGY